MQSTHFSTLNKSTCKHGIPQTLVPLDSAAHLAGTSGLNCHTLFNIHKPSLCHPTLCSSYTVYISHDLFFRSWMKLLTTITNLLANKLHSISNICQGRRNNQNNLSEASHYSVFQRHCKVSKIVVRWEFSLIDSASSSLFRFYTEKSLNQHLNF